MDEGSTRGTQEKGRNFKSGLTLPLDRPFKGEKVRRRLGMRIDSKNNQNCKKKLLL